jgi:hypothetical protein
MPERDPETGLLYDDLPWKPKHEHTRFRVRVADYEWLCIPPNAVAIDPDGYPYPPTPTGYSGRAAAAVHADDPHPVFVTIPWTPDGLALAREFWSRVGGWLGTTALASVLDQLERASGELTRRAADPPPPPPRDPMTWDAS